jgi:hypothetical protein
VEWDDSFDNILDLPEENGVIVDSDCRVGYAALARFNLFQAKRTWRRMKGWMIRTGIGM